MEDKNKEFKLHDFYQAVILRAVGFPLLRLERISGRFVEFVFWDPEKKAEETLKKYWNRQIKTDARSLIEVICELKTRLFTPSI